MPRDGTVAPREPAAGPDTSGVLELLDGVGNLAAAMGREDLVARLMTARQRVLRSETVVCVVGEFKQGKSALINGLLSTDVCPVDDDLATMAVTIVRHGDPPTATVRRREDGRLVVESIPPDAVADWVTEGANPDNRRNVELVEVAITDPFLDRGLTLVDTPGVGGLNAAHAAATLAFLPLADALVFVTDASAELTLAELEFLGRATEAGPPVLLALTKIDMYPEWRRILAIDERRLQAAGLDLAPFPLSSTLRAVARELGEPGLERESGYPAFVEALAEDVAPRALASSISGALRELRGGIDQLREPVTAELGALERPEAAERMAADLDLVRARLTGLTEAGSDWSVRLDDEFGSLRARTAFGIQGQMRRIQREANEEIERIDPGRTWSEFSQEIQAQVAGAVRGAFLEVTEGAAGIQAAIGRLLAEEELALGETEEPLEFDVRSLWKGGQVFEGTLRTGAIAGFGLLAGASVGVEMLGMLGALLGTALVGPALLGAALFFGGREVAAERRRLLTDRRQQARTFVGEFIENAQFEVDGRLASLASELQRQMRARFAERIRELIRTCQEAAAGLERAMEKDEADRASRSAELRAELDSLDSLGRRLEVLEASTTRAA